MFWFYRIFGAIAQKMIQPCSINSKYLIKQILINLNKNQYHVKLFYII